jgi:hypothetical protein
MSRSGEEREVSVTEATGQYVQATEGPATDTTVHTKSTPGIVPDIQVPASISPPRPAADPDLPDIRKSARRPSEVDHHRVRRPRASNPLLVGILLFLLIVGLGGTALVVAVRRDHHDPPPPAPPPEKIGGVPVRQGMKGKVD